MRVRSEKDKEVVAVPRNDARHRVRGRHGLLEEGHLLGIESYDYVVTVTERSVWTMAVSRSARDGAKSTPLNFFIRCDEVEDADGDGGDGKSSKVW